MERITIDKSEQSERVQSPISFIPTPSASYRKHRKATALILEPGLPRVGLGDAPGAGYAQGARVLMWKQDPSVREIGTRKVFLPGLVLAGPRDARLMFGQPGITPVAPNAFGDFVTMPDTPQFDAVHTYAVLRQTLTMYQRFATVLWCARWWCRRCRWTKITYPAPSLRQGWKICRARCRTGARAAAP